MNHAAVVYAPDEDRHSHQPSASDPELFHETWCIEWYDHRRRSAGHHHIGQYRNLGVADVWSWVAVDGRVIAHHEDLQLPLATGDHTDMELGGIAVKATDDRTQLVDVRHGAVGVHVEYTAFTRPFSFSMESHGAGYGSGHLESMGRVAGTLTTADGDAFDISGWAYHDHSWGARDYGSVLSQRWVYGVFGPDLFFSSIALVLPSGTMHVGYVFDQGEFHCIDEASYGVRVATDGHTPEACDLTMWTADGRGYRATGEVTVSGTSRHNSGYFQTDGFGPMQLGGRVGTGIINLNERSIAPPFVDPQATK
jgi:hypothetical protein